MSFWTGKKEKFEQRSTLNPQQIPVLQQLLDALSGKETGGAYGDLADYYRDLFDENGQNYNALSAPEMRNFRENIIPSLAEQFAGMGSGALSSSGFRNAAVNAGASLSERLAAIRAQLRGQGAQGLQSLGQQGLGNYTENIYRPRQPGFLDSVAKGVGQGAGMAAGSWATGGMGPAASAAQQATPLAWGQGGFTPTQGNFDPYK